ncbi:MAG: glutamate synthase subunit alpha, partial [Armatimonadetes bacterium]|nr:glutamate synthase subunit alpha [Armatimonadota bacterium]
IMAELGFRTVEEMVGRMDRLDIQSAVDHWKTAGMDLTPLLTQPNVADSVARRRVTSQDHGLTTILDRKLIALAQPALESGESVSHALGIRNSDRTTATMLSGDIARKFGEAGLPADTIRFDFTGSAGQSFGCFLAPGITLTVEGDVNDYLGKGMAGGRIVVYPPRTAPFDPTENIIAGNTLLYGATGGEVFLRGVAGERFGVRNSGATAVVEGAGDHCCEYMTGGVVVVLGKTGRNFAAGMSGGVAYVWDKDGNFEDYLNDNHGLITLETVSEAHDVEALHTLISRHLEYTRSDRAAVLLQNWAMTQGQFKKVISKEYLRAQAELASATAGA